MDDSDRHPTRDTEDDRVPWELDFTYARVRRPRLVPPARDRDHARDQDDSHADRGGADRNAVTPIRATPPPGSGPRHSSGATPRPRRRRWTIHTTETVVKSLCGTALVAGTAALVILAFSV